MPIGLYKPISGLLRNSRLRSGDILCFQLKCEIRTGLAPVSEVQALDGKDLEEKDTAASPDDSAKPSSSSLASSLSSSSRHFPLVRGYARYSRLGHSPYLHLSTVRDYFVVRSAGTY